MGGGRWTGVIEVSWLKHRSAAVEAAAPPFVDPVAEEPIAAPCGELGCQGEHRVACDYRDRRGAPCSTAWCPDHIETVGRWHLCRRHARLVQVLAPIEFRGELPAPDLDNRAPSLTSYLGQAIDAPMRSLLEELCHSGNGERVGVEPLTLVSSRSGGRRWTQSWKIYDSTGPLLRVAVEVDESRDPECAVRLNGRVIVRCVPPWIEDRQGGASASASASAPAPDPTEEEARRRLFFDTLVEQHIRPAVVDEERWARRWDRSALTAAGR